MILCLHQIDKNLYRTKTLRDLQSLIKRVDKLRKHLAKDLEFRRVYIPKASSGSFAESDRHTFRPLGVPSLPWRVYLNMLEHPLVLSAPLDDRQHGFTPNRGTLTAWSEMFKKVIPSENIYEIDLKQCFPSINLHTVNKLLRDRYHYPSWIRNIYRRLNTTTPELKGKLHCNEIQSQLLDSYEARATVPDSLWKKVSEKYNYRTTPNFTELADLVGEEEADKFITSDKYYKLAMSLPADSSVRRMYFPDLKLPKEEKVRKWYNRRIGFERPGTYCEEGDHPFEDKTPELIGLPISTIRAYLLSTKRANIFAYRNEVHDLLNWLTSGLPPNLATKQVKFLENIGTTQGSPLSPYLSAIALQEINTHLPEGVEIIQYADDMIFYGPNLENFIGPEGTGLESYLRNLGFTMHMEKSGWLKRGNKITKAEIKFLGMIYNQEEGTFYSQTRKGNTLMFTKEDLLSAEYDINEMIIGTDKLTGKSLSSDSLESRIFDKVLLYQKRLKVEKGKQAAGNYNRVNLVRDLVIHYSNQLALFVMFRMSRIHYEYFYLILRVMSQPFSSLYRLLLTGAFTLGDFSSRYLISNVFTKAGSAKDEINILDSKHPSKLTWRKSLVGDDLDLSAANNSDLNLIRSPGMYTMYPGLRFFLGLLFGRILNRENGYLRAYRNTYTFINFVNSKLAGLLLARLYCGSWTTENIVQDFTYKVRIFSLGWYLQSSQTNIFNGSSKATHELVTWLSGHNPRLERLGRGIDDFRPFSTFGDELDPNWDEAFLRECIKADTAWRTAKNNFTTWCNDYTLWPKARSLTVYGDIITKNYLDWLKNTTLDSWVALHAYSHFSRKLASNDTRLEHWVNQWAMPKR